MIITRYLVRETFKSQLAILFVLLLIFFCQKLVRILSLAVDGDIPINLVLSLLSLGVPEMAQLILPLSLFLGLLMTLSRMYTESEITVIYACGLGKNVLIHAALVLSLITMIFAGVNIVWFLPWSLRYQDLVIAEAKANPSIVSLTEGQFKLIGTSNSVLFISNMKNKEFKHVFLAQIKPNNNVYHSIVIADHGYITQRPDRSQLVTLDKGTYYEGTAMLGNFRITDFIQYKMVINHRAVSLDSTDTKQMTLRQLWCSPKLEARTELHWRLTLIVSVLIMAMMVVPLSVINQRDDRILSILSAMLLYLIFFLLQTLLRFNGANSKPNIIFWIWLTNIAYLLLAILLNLWDSITVRKILGQLYVREVA